MDGIKRYTGLVDAYGRIPIVFQGHLSIFKVTRAKETAE